MAELARKAEITTRRTGELKQGVLKVLLNNPDGLQAKNVLLELSQLVPPTAFESSDYPSRPGDRRYEKIVRFGTINMTHARWMTKTKGHWAITEDGKLALERYTDPEQFEQACRRLYKEWEESRNDALLEMAITENEPQATNVFEEVVNSFGTFEEAEETAWSQIQRHINELDGYQFQDLVENLLEAMNYHVSWKAPKGKDGGVDLIAHSDPLGTSTPRIMVQVKRQVSKVDEQGLRSFQAVVGSHDVGLFICTGGFTKDATEAARKNQTCRVSCLNLEHLFDLWVKHYHKLSESGCKLLPIRPIYYLNSGSS